MRLSAGTTDVPTAGTAVQLSNTADRVKKIQLHGRAGNSGIVYFGGSDVSSTNGWEVAVDGTLSLDFGSGSVLFSTLYADAATNGDDVDWVVILA